MPKHSERRKASRTNQADEATVSLLASLVDSSDDAIISKTPTGIVTSWNRAAELMYGWSAEEIIGKSVRTITPPDRYGEVHAILARVRSGERVEHYETVRVRKDGVLFDVSLTVSPIRDSIGALIGVSTIARDITERKLAEEQARAALLYARSLIEVSLDPLVTISPEGKITDVNEATVKVTGVSSAELIGTDFSDYFTEPGRAREGYQEVFSRGFVTDYPLTIRHKDGGLVHVLYNASVYRDVRGNVLGVFAAARDVTAQQQAAQYARSLIEVSLDPLVTISPEGKITDVNEATVRATGVPRTSLVGTDFSGYFTEPEKARSGYEQVFSQGFVTDYPLTIRHRDASLMDVLYNASVYRDMRGEVLGVFAAARDVTAQQQAAQYARSLIEASPDPLVTISPEGKVTDVNEATVRATGVPRASLVGTDFSGYFTEPEKARSGYEQVFSQGFVTDYPLTIRHRDGSLMDVLYNASVYRDVRGNVLGVFAAARDVTERRRAEEELRRHQERLEQLVEERTADLETRSAQLLAAERARSELLVTLNREISHRVKNNLAMVAGMLQMQIASDRDPRLAEMLQEAIARLYAFASVHEQLAVTETGEVNLTAAVRQCAEAVRRVFLQGDVAISVDGDALHYPSSTATNISVIANELITNAVRHGTPEDDGQRRVDVRLGCDDGAFRLSVWNSGNSVPAGLDPSQQTGLGLSLVQSLVVGQYRGAFTLAPDGDGTLARVEISDERLREG